MNYLIIGGTGFIGHNLAKDLSLNTKNNITIIDNLSRGKLDKSIKNLIKKKNVSFIKIDLTEKFSLKKIKNNYNYIINLAAIIGVKNVLKSPYDVLSKNYEIQKNAIMIAKMQKKILRFIFSSSSEIYSGTYNTKDIIIPTPENCKITLNSFENPRSTYMLSKIYGEVMTNMSGLPFSIVRFHNIYGPRMGMSHVIPELIKKIALSKKKNMRIENLNHSRTFCYIDDAVKMLIEVIKNKKSLNKVINIGNQLPEVKIKYIAYEIARILNKKMKFINKKSSNFSQKRRCPNTAFIRKIFKNKKRVGLSDGIFLTYKWYKENKLIK